MRISWGRATDDAEKLVTPGIVYASKTRNGTTARLIAAGWWDYHVTFIWRARAKQEAR